VCKGYVEFLYEIEISKIIAGIAEYLD
jgi:hypothetical protein